MSQMDKKENKELPPLPVHARESKTLMQPQIRPTASSLPYTKNATEPHLSLKSMDLSNLNNRSKPQNLMTRRAGPFLTLNLDNNSNNNGPRVSSDTPLVSPAQFSASSAEDWNCLDGDITPSDKGKHLSLPMKNIGLLNKNIVINQQSIPNMISTRAANDQAPEKMTTELKSLNRRNFKKLTLEPFSLDLPNNSTSSLILTDSPIAKLEIKDPEKKIDANELIENIKNLELGLEYQMPIRADELVGLKKLGSGQSGTVSKVLHLPTQKTMARKVVHLEAKELVQSQIMRELRIMHECDSPFIIEFYGTFLNEGNVVICMEYADCGSLEHIFKITGPFPEFMLKHVAHSVLSGLIYLYDQHRILHRDVKPSNVLLTSKGKIKLCDFGVSRELINSMADTFVGTSTYMSPERIQGGVYSVKGDVWSLGIMLYELASGKLAFTNDNSGHVSILELLQRIVNEQPPSLSVKDGFSGELVDFISLCLKKENQRSSPWDLMNHPFLQDFLDEDGVRVSAKYRGNIRKWCKNVRRVQKGKPIL